VKGIKISTIVDTNGRPVSTIVPPANMHDSKLYQPTLERFRIKIGIGMSITRPITMVADAAPSNEIKHDNIQYIH